MKTPQPLLMLALLAVGLPASGDDIRAGLLSYWPFDISTTVDSAFTNDFTAVNSPALVTTNPFPRLSVLELDGSSYLRLDHTSDNAANGLPIHNAGIYSILFWVKAPPQSEKYVFTEGSTLANAPLILFQTGPSGSDNNKLNVYIRSDAPHDLVNFVDSSSTVFDNTWHHVAWVDSNGNVKLYIDGNLDANSAAFSYVNAPISLNTTALGTLVRAAVSTGGIFTGQLEDVSLWERALTQTEVQSIMTNGIATPVPALPPVVVTQPASATTHVGDNATFSVTAVGTRPNNILTYQWMRNNAPVLDATNQTYSVSGLTTNNSGETYSVAISNAVGGTISSNAVLTVLPDVPPDLRAGIVSYWPLDSVSDNSGAYTSPDVYSGNDLVLSNMTEANLATGQFSNALSFDNLANTYAIRSHGSPIYNPAAYSISMWVRADGSIQSDARVFSEGSTNSNLPLFTIGTAAVAGPGGHATIFIRSDSGNQLLGRDSARTVFDNNWHHIVWVDVAGQAKLYVDGILDETDFSYTTGVLTLNVTSIGAVVRALPSNLVFGNIDEVCVWNRALSFTEIQQIKNSGIPGPLASIPPNIIAQPASTNVFTGADVSFGVQVSGTFPFSYQWYKDGNAVANATNPTLPLHNVQLTDAGNYQVAVTNSGGWTTSSIAILTVIQRPAPPSTLALDFNNRTESSGYTETGFASFSLDGSSASPNPVTTPTTKVFGGVEVTVGGSGGVTIDSRRRFSPVNTGAFTEEKLLQDFVFSQPNAGTNGLDVRVRFMKPSQTYFVTVWSFDSGNGGEDQVSDWYVDGNLVYDNYVFDGAIAPTNNQQYQISFNAISDAEGTILVQGRREAGVAVFLNALRLELPPTRVQSVQLVAGNVRLLVQTPDSSKPHVVEETSNLSNVSWTTVSGVASTVINPTSVQLEFPIPAAGMKFYRVSHGP